MRRAHTRAPDPRVAIAWRLVGAASLVLTVAVAGACSYGASFDDCRVSACRGPSDCPGGFTCDGDGFCRAPGATIACSVVLVDGGLDGNGDAPAGCSGTVSACTTFVSNPACVAQTGCGWVDPTCVVTTNCSQYTTNTACMAVAECVTDFSTSTCVRRTNYCTGTSQSVCESKPACMFQGGCSGTADVCTAFTSQTGCTAQTGCSWH